MLTRGWSQFHVPRLVATPRLPTVNTRSMYLFIATSLLIAQVSIRGRLRRALPESLGFMPTGCPLTADTRHQSVGGGLPPQGRVTVANRPNGGLKLSLYIGGNRSMVGCCWRVWEPSVALGLGLCRSGSYLTDRLSSGCRCLSSCACTHGIGNSSELARSPRGTSLGGKLSRLLGGQFI